MSDMKGMNVNVRVKKTRNRWSQGFESRLDQGKNLQVGGGGVWVGKERSHRGAWHEVLPILSSVWPCV